MPLKFIEAPKKPKTVDARLMDPDSTGIIEDSSTAYDGSPVRRTAYGLVQIGHGGSWWATCPSYQVRLCDFELREIPATN